jgi:hypothetical protein
LLYLIKDKVKTIRVIKKFRKILLRTILAIIALFVLLVLITSIPAVQTAIGKRITKSINKDYGTNINVGGLSVTLRGNIKLKDIYIEDHKQDTLIYAKALKTSLLSIRKPLNGILEFGDMTLSDFDFNIKTYEGESNTNLNIFVEKFEDPKKDSVQSSFFLSSARVRLEAGVFNISDENRSNTQLLHFDALNASLDNFIIDGPEVSCAIKELSFTSKRGLKMQQLQADFKYSLNQMRLDALRINTLLSELSGNLIFDYDRDDFADFENKVKLSGSFQSSKVAFDEINLLYDEFGEGRVAFFNTEISGVLNELNFNNLNLVSTDSRIKGELYFKNLFNSSKPFYMEGDFSDLSSNYGDLKDLLPNILGKTLPSSFAKLGQFTIKGKSIITQTMIDAQLTLDTKIGRSQSDLTLTNIRNIDNASYEGVISLQGFHLGKFLNNKSLGKTSLKLNVNGKGFTQQTLNTEIIGRVDTLNFNGYRYTGIDVSGILKDQLFDGKLLVNDPNFKINFDGLADFSSDINKFNFNASVLFADLNTLNFVSRDNISIFKGDVRIDAIGNNLDNMEGEITFNKTYYKNQNDAYFFDDFKVSSSFTDNVRLLSIDSPDIIEGFLTGNYSFNELGKLIENSVGSIYANYSPNKVAEGQFLDFNFKIYNKIVEVFFPKLKFGPNTYIRGKIVADEGLFRFAFKSPKIEVFEYEMDSIDLKVDNKNPLFNTYVQVDKINTGFYNAAKFNLINKTIKDTLFFKTEFIGGKDQEDLFDLNFYHTINEFNKSVVGIKKSAINFKGNQWYLNEEEDKKNRVVFNKTLDTINIENIVMNHNDEFISVRGVLLDSTYKDIQMGFKVVDLNKITPEIDSLSFDGVVDGKINIIQRQGRYFPNANISIASVSVNAYSYGDLMIDIEGNERFNEFEINTNIIKEGQKAFEAKGNMTVSNDNATINMQTELSRFNLFPFSPLGQDVIQNIRGFASGKASITGNLDNPMINGYLELDETGLNIPYLNVDLAFQENASVLLKEQAFIFNNIEITDTAFNTKGVLDGSISHITFSDWRLNLNLIADERLLVLNKEEDEDELYYGSAFISGNASIIGATDALMIKVVATSQAGTSIKIPISDVASIGDESFITFINSNAVAEEKARRIDQIDDFKGLELEFDLDITRDAEVEIVLDKKTGSTLKGRGAGIILMEINTKGKFNIYGDFTAYEGIYNYKNFGLIDKKFAVQPGGTIVWDGAATDAELDITAIYRLEANPAVLLSTQSGSLNRKIPTEVEIRLTGDLMTPTPILDIKFPNTSGIIKSELEYSLQDDDRRQLQAWSLLSQGIFVNEINISQSAVTGNLLETASSLFNDILSDEDDVFNVGVNISQDDRSLVNLESDYRLGLTVTTQITEGILLNSKIGLPLGGVNQTDIVGNFDLDILLNEDGSFRANIFNRENELQYASVADNIGYTQGVGLSYEYDFDSFKELIKKIFTRANKESKRRQSLNQKKDSIVEPKLINFRAKKKKSS